MAHRWEALIDFPWAKIYFEVSVDILDHNAAERTAGMCVRVCVSVMSKNRSNKWSTQAKAECLAHSVCCIISILGGVGSCFAFHF